MIWVLVGMVVDGAGVVVVAEFAVVVADVSLSMPLPSGSPMATIVSIELTLC